MARLAFAVGQMVLALDNVSWFNATVRIMSP